MASSRIQISEEHKNILKSYYERGMKSTKKEMARIIQECAEKVSLTEEQVKNWINNYNAKLNGSGNRQTAKSKPQLHRKQSGYNLFTSDVLQKDKIGGSAGAFRSVGEKWRAMDEECKEAYRKKAREDPDNVAVQSSDKAQALKIIGNMMKEVGELEKRGGHCIVLCYYDGEVFHGESAIGEKLVNKQDLVRTFGNLVQVKHTKKEEVSTKDLQELFNSKYGDLVGKTGQKMPYARTKQMGIVFHGLPDTLADIEEDPRKPHLYGSAQRRKLWLAQDKWKFVISDSIVSSIVTSSTITSQQSITTTPCSTVTSPNTISSIVTSPNTISSIVTSPNTISSIVTSPNTISSIVTSPNTISSIVTSPNTISSIVTSPNTIITTPSSTVTSTSLIRCQPNSFPSTTNSPASFSMVASSGHSLSRISSSSSGTVISKDTQLGMTVPGGNGVIHASCQLEPRQILHGRPVAPGNAVVRVLQIHKPLLPLFPGGFDQDEPLCVGGFYEWPCSHLILM